METDALLSPIYAVVITRIGVSGCGVSLPERGINLSDASIGLSKQSVNVLSASDEFAG